MAAAPPFDLILCDAARLYTENAKAKAANHDMEVFSINEPAT